MNWGLWVADGDRRWHVENESVRLHQDCGFIFIKVKGFSVKMPMTDDKNPILFIIFNLNKVIMLQENNNIMGTFQQQRRYYLLIQQ